MTSTPSRAESVLRATYRRTNATTALADCFEAGALRLRHPRRADVCESLILNTGGGFLGGDRMSLAIRVEPEAALVLSTVAAEKIYRTDLAPATLATALTLDRGARLDWVPQETILFDRARLDRRLGVDMAGDATLLAAEMLVFGRLAMGETAITGHLRDSWRVRRAGRLVFADATRIEGDIGATLDRPALGGGARAAALILLVSPSSETMLDPVRAALAPFASVTAGASAWDGILVARLLARSPADLRAAMVAALRVLSGRSLPRVWQ